MAATDARPVMRRPVPVTVAFWLVLAGAAVVLLMLVLGFVTGWDAHLESTGETLAEDGPYTQDELESVARISVGIVSAALVGAMALYVTFGALMQGGRNWARVTLTVLLSIGCFLAVVAAIVPFPPVVRVLSAPLALISIGAIVTMFAGSAGPYFDYRARMRS